MARVKVIRVPQRVQVPPGNVTGPEWTQSQAMQERIRTRVFDVRDFGAVGDEVADDTAALQACADAARNGGGTFYQPQHMSCRITSTLDLQYIHDVDVRGRIVVSHTSGVGVLAGHRSDRTVATKILLNEVVYAVGSQTNITIRLVGLKNGNVTINRTEYLQLYADAADPLISSIAYSQFMFGKIDKHELYGEAGLSWITRNHFWGGRIRDVVVTGAGYSHNDNVWHGPNLEHATITFNTGHNNYFYDVRAESGCDAIFASGTRGNRLYQIWMSNTSLSWSTINVIDNGFDNRAMTAPQQEGESRTVFRVDSRSRITNTASEYALAGETYITPGFQKLRVPTAGVALFDTGRFPVKSTQPAPDSEGGMRIARFRFQSDVSLWRPRVYVYHANGNPLNGSSTDYIDRTGGWSWSENGYYTFGVNRGETPTRIVFAHPSVAFARIVVASGAVGSFEYVQLTALVQPPHGDEIVDLIRRQMSRPLFQTSSTTAPSMALLPLGDTIATPTGQWVVAHRRDSILQASVLSGATTVTMGTVLGVENGDRIAILRDDGTTHFATITGLSGNDVSFTPGLPSAASYRNAVATFRFVHTP